ncbi:hypothetical protein L2750_09345 [Shewanella submarina]|uniref:Lipoprotein n=1 Tax=Shewanella submarina TaxID=2016376 RepID=A0ABV7G6V6_9GAMM|nr:hypothetical protein [Shewanella submarina]MCL1037359.1 hypothetical protein [Shewanella submarina]
MFKVLLLLLFLVGCTTVKITDTDGSVSVTREFGFIQISANPEEGAVYTDISVLGYATTPLGQVVGYSKQSIAVMSEKCKLVLWVDNTVNPSIVKELLKYNESICVFEPDHHEEN